MSLPEIEDTLQARIEAVMRGIGPFSIDLVLACYLVRSLIEHYGKLEESRIIGDANNLVVVCEGVIYQVKHLHYYAGES
jgi:hypothetical protein